MLALQLLPLLLLPQLMFSELLLAALSTERTLFLPGSNGSTTTSSVPLISARQNGQPCPSDSCDVPTKATIN